MRLLPVMLLSQLVGRLAAAVMTPAGRFEEI
jgi:hypothetical protein